MRIALFATCIVDAMYPATARATVKILERLGHEVVFPSGQACCGQMHVNSGYLKEAVPVIANHVAAFDAEDYDVAVAPSGSCVASVKHQHPMVARSCGDTALEERATAVGAKVYELSELLVDVLGITDAGGQLGSYFPHRVTYHPSCHGMRLLRLGDRQAQLLGSVVGIELAELPEADQCCGFGGTFSMKNADVSSAMLKDKTAKIIATGATLCAGGDASCLMHIGGGLSRQGSDVTTLHLAEILASTVEEPASVTGDIRVSTRKATR
ncbi:(Fe-S)-binding protein [Arthrobacter sp. VKM Ac-2550]|uniref:(Fe-S)-binding protein n=1 Tax=Crystallibacter permensis TaxID=1938888 RepID=UPI002226DA9B|nr:(Fe-S)-binding protein [Arthrobacter sp. VKM Ac-2550]MCW2131210.1 L-lactate dehydrogenase complex protein LldE [Arthrobacter sp. VKM Ac-2550]